MKISKAKYEATNRYKAKAYKRIPLDVRIEEYEQIKAASSATGESVNGYIRKAVQDRINRDKSELERLDKIGYTLEEIATD